MKPCGHFCPSPPLPVTGFVSQRTLQPRRPSCSSLLSCPDDPGWAVRLREVTIPSSFFCSFSQQSSKEAFSTPSSEAHMGPSLQMPGRLKSWRQGTVFLVRSSYFYQRTPTPTPSFGVLLGGEDNLMGQILWTRVTMTQVGPSQCLHRLLA